MSTILKRHLGGILEWADDKAVFSIPGNTLPRQANDVQLTLKL
jgi:hypothetical protein